MHAVDEAFVRGVHGAEFQSNERSSHTAASVICVLQCYMPSTGLQKQSIQVSIPSEVPPTRHPC
jgi:hypothetical protein